MVPLYESVQNPNMIVVEPGPFYLYIKHILQYVPGYYHNKQMAEVL
jgi:hypothetical protein